MIRNYKPELLEILKKIVLEDEFDDSKQNKDLYQGSISSEDFLVDFFKRNCKPGRVLDIGCGSGGSIKVFPEITDLVDPNPKRVQEARSLVSSLERSITVKTGWLENIPYEDETFDTVLCWGTFRFARSQMEALVELNRVLKLGGILMLDVSAYSNLPLAQTTNPRCFKNWCSLFGFDAIEMRKATNDKKNEKWAFAFEKVEPFNYRRLLLPQCKGKVLNYLEERDWFLI